MPNESKQAESPDVTFDDLGANRFTFRGDRTSVTFFPVTPSPGPTPVGQEGGQFVYDGPEGSFTVFGPDIERVDSAIGTLLTILLRPDFDAGAIKFTLVLPRAIGVTRQAPVTFVTVGIRTTSRGFVAVPGVELTYDVLPLLGEAANVILPV